MYACTAIGECWWNWVLCLPSHFSISQDDKERLRAQLALASQGSGASEARLAEKDEALAQLQ